MNTANRIASKGRNGKANLRTRDIGAPAKGGVKRDNRAAARRGRRVDSQWVMASQS